jgi:hypothetical protein
VIRVGGITTLSVVFLVAIASLLGLMTAPPVLATTLLFMLSFAALGAGNGATFQLVPLRWPLTTAVAGGMIGEIGALGGGILPNLLGQIQAAHGFILCGFPALRRSRHRGAHCHADRSPLLDTFLDSSGGPCHRCCTGPSYCCNCWIKTR